MSPNGGGEPQGDLANAINDAFGDFASFKDVFSKAAATRFGSGWAWLSVDNGKLVVESTPNQDSPLMEGRTPILHAAVRERGANCDESGEILVFAAQTIIDPSCLTAVNIFTAIFCA